MGYNKQAHRFVFQQGEAAEVCEIPPSKSSAPMSEEYMKVQASRHNCHNASSHRVKKLNVWSLPQHVRVE